MNVLRRGACPSLVDPMLTGDGLLARIHPLGGIAPAAFARLCESAQRHGNGVLEITQRGNIQARGLTPASAILFAEDIAALGIARAESVPITTNPLAGLDPTELIDANALIGALHRALEQTELTDALDAKVSVAIDNGGALHLDALTADIRLRAARHSAGLLWHLAVAGTAAESASLGSVAPEQAADAVMALLRVIATHGPGARARDVLLTGGAEIFRSAIRKYLLDAPAPAGRTAPDPIGPHPISGDRFALGLGLGFQGDARALSELSLAAAESGAGEMRAAPGRTLFVVGLHRPAAGIFLGRAQRLGFITRPDDPRSRIAACAGAPQCRSGEIAARPLAAVLAERASALFDGTLDLHISGCPKGCAQAGRAALTIVGTPGRCGIIIDGSPQGLPIVEMSVPSLPAAFDRLAREVQSARRPGERSSDVLARWGHARVGAVLAGELVGA